MHGHIKDTPECEGTFDIVKVYLLLTNIYLLHHVMIRIHLI